VLRHLRIQTALVLGLAFAGCASLPDKTVRFQGLSDCPAQTPATLLAQQQEFGPGSSTHMLQCALTVARESSDPALRRSALPSRLALHLAERDANTPQKEALANEGVSLAEQAYNESPGRADLDMVLAIVYLAADRREDAVRHLALAEQRDTIGFHREELTALRRELATQANR